MAGQHAQCGKRIGGICGKRHQALVFPCGLDTARAKRVNHKCRYALLIEQLGPISDLLGVNAARAVNQNDGRQFGVGRRVGRQHQFAARRGRGSRAAGLHQVAHGGRCAGGVAVDPVTRAAFEISQRRDGLGVGGQTGPG